MCVRWPSSPPLAVLFVFPPGLRNFCFGYHPVPEYVRVARCFLREISNHTDLALDRERVELPNVLLFHVKQDRRFLVGF